MRPKPFSADLYAENDDAKHQVVKWLEARGYEAWINPDQYGIDVLAQKDGLEYEFEVEVKHNWTGKNFQYKTVNFPKRKLKFAKPSETTVFFMLNHERTHALMVTGPVFLASKIIMKATKYTRLEEFIDVPVDQCVFVEMDNPDVVSD